jgi:MFS family permease
MAADQNNNVTRDVTVVHFLLMFGYKLFSVYFPLFLAASGFSLPQVGWSYLLIYLPIAVGAPFIGFLCRKTNPVLLMVSGVLGYAMYALAMIFAGNSAFFYFWQVVLGLSAALFFTSSRILLMGYPMRNVERGFSWFYNAPNWADIVAPAVGAFLLWKTNFTVIFLACFVIQTAGAAYALFKLWRVPVPAKTDFTVSDWLANWRSLFKKLANRRVAPYALVSFALLWQAGLYSAFFVLFLKNSLSWNKNQILLFIPLAAAVFSIAYFAVIRPAQKDKNESSIVNGSLVSSFASLLFLLPLPLLNSINVFAIDFVQNAGAFLSVSGRSALLTRKLVTVPAEAGALDTMFSPLGTAFGSLTAGFLIGPLGYQGLFFWGGAIVIVLTLVARWIAIAGKD